jgi:Domain of unknown function (DUF4202)
MICAMFEPTPRFYAVVAEIDAANASDPRTIVVGGAVRPYEIVYAERMGERLTKDKESQALENVVAVVFLEHYFDEFHSKHDHYSDDKIVDIIGKTLRKMSPKGHSAALSLALPKRTRKLVEAALARQAPVLEKLASVAID